MSRVAAMLAVFPLVVLSGLFGLIALYLALARCDESCDSSGRWWHDAGAWQWNGFLLLAAVGVVAALGLLFSVALARTRLGAGALVVWTLCAGTFAALLGQAGFRRHAAAGWYGIAVLALLGVVSLALASERPGLPRTEKRADT